MLTGESCSKMASKGGELHSRQSDPLTDWREIMKAEARLLKMGEKSSSISVRFNQERLFALFYVFL